IDQSIHMDEYEGVFNNTRPNPLTQNDLGKAIGTILGKPHWIPVPSLVLKVILGEQSNMILNTQKVLPVRLESKGFEFKFSNINDALIDLI
ncbi:MAG TPA: DUF1731 domain-containing protein, partial [Jeotgalicoccus sp.]|nr:DUF1731 domain-containing protein [Jeotgalicoccus sp.]